MNKIYLIVLLIFVIGCQEPSNNKGQTSQYSIDSNSSITKIEKIEEENPSCIYKKTSKIISSAYPFSKSDKIEVVSYPLRRDGYSNDTLIVNGKFTVKGIQDRVILTNQQIDTLFSILYDYNMKNRINGESSIVDCYTPRHSIIFYKNNISFAFYEICLDCGGTRQTKNINFGEFCSEKLCKVQKYFRSIGIINGITDEYCY